MQRTMQKAAQKTAHSINIFKVVYLSLILTTLSGSVIAKTDIYEKMAQQMQSYQNQYNKNNSHYQQQYNQGLQEYRDTYRRHLSDYKSRVEQQWGVAETSTPSKLVLYTPQMTEKLVVDYQQNRVIVSKQNQSTANTEDLESLLVDALSMPISQLSTRFEVEPGMALPRAEAEAGKGVSTLAESLAISPVDIAPLAKQIIGNQDAQGEVDAVERTIKVLSDHAQQIQQSGKNLDADSSRKELQYANQLKLERQRAEKYRKHIEQASVKAKSTSYRGSVNPSRWQRSQAYRQYVAQQSKANAVPESLIYAVMETESDFNPLAVSPVFALGLMQVVPTTAGIDVNQYLYNDPTPPAKSTLFQPPQNVLFGTTYIKLLYFSYFTKIDDPTSRLYCTIAAYNTGMGNVAKVFNGDSMSVNKAAKKINGMTSEQVYQQLLRNLPAQETRDYLVKVLAAMRYYDNELAS
ncbi:transglycosylase SLT domain-containing protein [uncultured Shewanella sp.]|uniref:transglycosylase SLT domain-containing protein n=1 Tax=uncultured Shewanella sp. TaxID=173975 RepID=UPI00261A32FA|nr:transglycosylase SLT domain-containing protein [uncultured Shewanella sp.]